MTQVVGEFLIATDFLKQTARVHIQTLGQRDQGGQFGIGATVFDFFDDLATQAGTLRQLGYLETPQGSKRP